MTVILRDWLIDCEGLKHFPYKDTVGKLTIGVGSNLDDVGLSTEEISFMLDNDIARCKKNLSSFDWYTKSPEHVQMALINMCFNLGIGKLLKFTTMISFLKQGDYTSAANAAMHSLWARQVGERAHQVINLMSKGIL